MQSDSGGRLSVMQKTLQRIRKPLTECEQKTSKGGQAIEDKPNYDVGDTNCSTSSNPTSKSEPKQASSCTTSLSSNALSTCMSKASAGRSFKPLHQSEMSNAALPTSVPQRAPGKSFQPPLKSGTNQPVGIQAPEAKSESSVQSDEKG